MRLFPSLCYHNTAMKTTLIVDGYNAINAIPETRKKLKESLLSARSAIITIAKEYVRSSGYITDFCVVFDGQDKYRSRDRMDAGRARAQVFSRTGDGDDKIIRTVKEYSSTNRVIVASNDNYVRNMSRGYGASHIPVEDLVKKKIKRKAQKKATGKRISGRARSAINSEYKKALGLE